MSTFQDVLKRLFSRNVIITKTKSGKLKTIDFNKSQSQGSPTTYSNRARWRNGRNFSTVSGYGSGFTNEEIEALRKQMYLDYEIMDTDAIVSSVIDITADETTTLSEQGELLIIKTSDAKIKKVLNNLFYDIMNIEFNLWSWIRATCKYGDNFLYLQIAEGAGIVNVMPIHPALMIREEGSDKEPDAIRFRYEGDYGMTWGSNNYFEEYEVAHFRLLGDTNFLPYGRSIVEGGRQEFKRMRLAEDAMLLNRIMRAPERRLFKIDIGNIAPEEVDGYIEEISNMMKKTPYIDPTTGDFNLRYNILNSLDDYFLPVRGGDSGTAIETLPGLTNDGMREDVEYFKNKMISAFKVPKEYLGYAEEGGSGEKCIHPNTLIPLLNGKTLSVAEIADLTDKGETLWVYSFDFDTNRVIPAKIKHAKKTRLNAELVRVHLDNNEYIDCTPDHGFLLKNGQRVEAINLQPNDSLCAINRRLHIQRNSKYGSTYEQIYQPDTSKWEWTHVVVDNYFNGKIIDNGYIDGVFNKNNIIVRHHVDFNRYNNDPTNLLRMNRLDHFQLHAQNVKFGLLSEESRERCRLAQQEPEYRKKLSDNRKKYLELNPDAKHILKNSWLSKTHEERSEIVKSGITEERRQAFSETAKQIEFYKYGQAKLKELYPNGRTDLHKEKSVRWIPRPKFEEILEFVELNKNNINSNIKFKDFCKLFNYSYVAIRDSINNNGFTVNQFMNQYFGFTEGRSKDLKIDYINELALNYNTFESLCKFIGLTENTLKKQIEKTYIFEEWCNSILGKCYNHKVKYVEILTERSDTYNLEIDDKNHNYLTSTGVVIKNSALAQIDIRFARSIERVQKIVVSELYKIALVHLKVQGFEEEDLLNFELNLTNPSLIFERQKTDVLTARIDLAKSAREENPLLSDTYIYKNLWGFNDEEIEALKLQKIEDMKFQFRLKQIVEEGNDPEVTGKSFGTPHDIASMQVASKYMPGQFGETNKQLYTPDEREENEGKPQQFAGSFETARDKDFGRDPVGRRENAKVENYSRLTKKLEKFKVKPKNGVSMLNEENLLDLEDNYS